jgi:hypothetical protein
MAFPIDIRFISVEPSAALDAFVRDWAGKLEHVGPGIERCDVVIDRPHRHHRHGRRYEVRIALAVPGPDIIVGDHGGLSGAHEDAFVAVRDAFRAARRQLEDRVRIARDHAVGT